MFAVSTFTSALLALIGVPLETATLTGIIIVVQSVAGLRILQAAFPELQSSAITLLGPGFVAGTLLWTLPTQIAGSGALINGGVFIGIMLIAATCFWRMPRPRFHNIESSTGQILAIFGLAFVIMSSQWPRYVLVGVCLLVAGMTINSARTRLRSRVFGCALMTALAVYVLQWVEAKQGVYAHLVTDDYSYLEALRVHLIEFGIWEQWGPTNIATYHWLSIAWVGQLSQISLASGWVSITQVAPVIFSASIAACAFVLIRQLTNISMMEVLAPKYIVALVFVFLVVRIDFAGTSTFAVYAFALTALVLFHQLLYGVRSLAGWLMAVVTIAATVLAKLFVVPLVLSLIAVLLLSSPRRGRFHLNNWFISIGAVVLLCSTYAITMLFAGSRISNGAESAWTSAVADSGLVGTIFREWTPLAGSLIAPALLAIAIAIASPGHNEFKAQYWIIVVSLIFALLSELMIKPGFAIAIDSYFARPAICLALLGVAASFKVIDGRLLVDAAAGGVISLVFAPTSVLMERTIRHLPATLAESYLKTEALRQWFIPLFAGLVIATIAHFIRTKRFTTSRTAAGMILSAIVVVFATQNIFSALTSDEYRDPISDRSSSFVQSVMGDPELEAVGMWIDRNTDTDVVLATNTLCSADSGPTLNDQFLCRVSNVDYTLAHTSHRRFLLLGPRFAYENPERRDEYMRASLRFGASHSEDDRAKLVDLGADIFVLDKNFRTHRFSDASDQRQLLGIILETPRYAVLDLRD